MPKTSASALMNENSKYVLCFILTLVFSLQGCTTVSDEAARKSDAAECFEASGDTQTPSRFRQYYVRFHGGLLSAGYTQAKCKPNP